MQIDHGFTSRNFQILIITVNQHCLIDVHTNRMQTILIKKTDHLLDTILFHTSMYFNARKLQLTIITLMIHRVQTHSIFRINFLHITREKIYTLAPHFTYSRFHHNNKEMTEKNVRENIIITNFTNNYLK